MPDRPGRPDCSDFSPRDQGVGLSLRATPRPRVAPRRPDHNLMVRLSLACDVIDILLNERKVELAMHWNTQARNLARLVYR